MKPDCHLGYTRSQVEEILGPRVGEFDKWMRGQTMAVCNQDPEREWVGDGRDMQLVEVGPPRCDRPHGVVVYAWDLRNFVEGGRAYD